MEKKENKSKIWLAKFLSYIIDLDVISMALQISFARKVIVLQSALNMVNQFQEAEPTIDEKQQAELISTLEQEKKKIKIDKPLSKWLR